MRRPVSIFDVNLLALTYISLEYRVEVCLRCSCPRAQLQFGAGKRVIRIPDSAATIFRIYMCIHLISTIPDFIFSHFHILVTGSWNF